MRMKNFLLAGIAGGITDYLLGWLLYGILFMDFFGGGQPTHMEYIALGCLGFGLLMSYIYVNVANLTTFMSGLTAGAAIGLIMGIMHRFFDASMVATAIDWKIFGVGVIIDVIMGALVGGVVAAVNGAMSKPASA